MVWTESGGTGTLLPLVIYTSGNDHQLFIATDGNVGIGTDSPNQKLTVEGSVSLDEISSAGTDTAGYGQVWVKDDTPNILKYTDDAGTDFNVALSDGDTGGSGSAGSGNQYVELNIGGTTYKVLHDGTV